MRKTIKEYILITIGAVLVAISVHFFLSPANLAAGGVSGIAIILSKFLPQIPIGLMMLSMNIILFIVGFIFIGNSFGGKTIYASLSLSGITWVLERLFPMKGPVVEDLFIVMIFGVLISGVGMALVFNQNASTGGTDIIAKILNKYTHLEIGKALLISDFFISLGAAAVFGPLIGMYALLAVIINGFAIDAVIQGVSTCMQVTVISEKGEKIKSFVIDELSRGVTLYKATGAYTGDRKEVIVTVVSRREFIRLKDYVSMLDKTAFVTVANIHEVLGEGFKDITD
jgi:uncharacterized membrane-anchored protein YitT (DUF2179 family)